MTLPKSAKKRKTTSSFNPPQASSQNFVHEEEIRHAASDERPDVCDPQTMPEDHLAPQKRKAGLPHPSKSTMPRKSPVGKNEWARNIHDINMNDELESFRED